MADTNRDGNYTSNRDLDIRATTGGSRYTSGDEPARQRRTRSQHNVSDLILRLPLLHSPLKAARRANAKARGTSPMSHSDSLLHTPRSSQSPPVAHGEVGDGLNTVTEADTLETSPGAEVEEEMDIGADGRTKKGKEEAASEDSLFSESDHDRDSNSSPGQHTKWPTVTKKRPSPDTDAMRALSSPRSERHAKRAKLEAFQSLGHEQEHLEYREPLRDPDSGLPGRPKSYKRASSTKPTPSPSKISSSIFPPRAQSVPLGEEDAVRAIDFTSIPPSPRRSPSKCAVEILRAPSAPPPDEDRMDVDDTSGLLQFTNATHIALPRANPMFHFTVNFATPRETATPARSALPPALPLSPLSPLTPSPPTEGFPRMKSLLAKRAMANSLSSRRNSDAPTSSAGSVILTPAADTTTLDVFQSAAHVRRRPSPAASRSLGASATPVSSRSHFRHPLTWSRSMELMPPPATPARAEDAVQDATGGPGEGQHPLLNESDGAGRFSTGTLLDLPSAPTSRPGSVAISRRTVIGSMKPKRGPSVPRGAKRVTRSVSMKEQRVKYERTEIEDATGEDTTDSVAEPSSEAAEMPPPSTSQLRTLKPTGPVALPSKIPTTRHRSVSVSKLPPDASKLKQSSLYEFVKGKASMTGGATTLNSLNVSTSTSTASFSKTPAVPSPSKIPLPASPLKRPSASQSGNAKPFLFSLGSTSTGAGTGAARATSGRSLTTLSHALDKLAAPPPSRPNTSMGFVRGDGSSEEDGAPENSKGKGKAKDDTSLPRVSATQGKGTVFARPASSSLKRAATVTGLGSMAASRIRGRGGTALGGPGRGRGIFCKVGDRASKKTTLPVVAGSPVKGSGARDDMDEDGSDADKYASGLGAKDATGEDVFASQDVKMQDVSTEPSTGDAGSAASHKPSPPAAAHANNGIQIDLTSSPISADKGKQRAMPPSTLNPASAALHALSESLSSLPQTPTPPKPRVVGTRTGLRSSTTTKESPAGSSGGNSEVHGSGGAGPSSGTVNGSGGVKKSSLKILKRCAIFVDVRTEQGDDAGSLFVDMLKGLGAKIMGRLGQSCTHIVYKNGLPHTLTRYRMLNDPKPIVVGIAWVVECVEKRARVDEEKFKIDVDVINVAGNHKRRRTMLPKHLIPVSPGPDFDAPVHMSSEADEEDEGGVNGSPAQDPDISIRSREEDDLPPLERARRRRSVLPGGQTRLFT